MAEEKQTNGLERKKGTSQGTGEFVGQGDRMSTWVGKALGEIETVERDLSVSNF